MWVKGRKLTDKKALINLHDAISPFIHHTPILTSSYLNSLLEVSLLFKCENFQKAGAFKSRGAVNSLLSLSDNDLKKGVCTHSSGNHAQALSRAAAIFDTKAFIVMPKNSPPVKIDAVKNYKGIITFCEPTLEARENTLQIVRKRTGAMEIHPYNNLNVILGQATTAIEIFNDIKEQIDIIMTPVGGGGLLSGTAISTFHFSPTTLVVAAEPKGADDAYRSFKSGKLVLSSKPNTIADGLLTSLGSNTWPIIRDNVFDIFVAEDKYIIEAMKLIWERMKIIIEPSAAVPLAVLLKCKEEKNFDLFKHKRIAIILSGGNIDLNKIIQL